MSLINDALKRAKQAQQNQPTGGASGLELRPLEPQPPRGQRGFGLMLPMIFTFIALLGLFFLWQIKQTQTDVPARTPENAAATTTPTPAPTEPTPVEEKALTPSVPLDAAANKVALTPTNEAIVAPATEVPAPAATVETAPMPPALPKLQGIVFNPSRPSAMIGGKTVFVGDKVAGYRVLAITQDSATIVSATQTNLLTLE